MEDIPIGPLTRLLELLDKLEMHYFVGGSVASGVHGFVRTTNDVDLVVAIDVDQVEAFVETLLPRFYVDADHVRECMRRERSFNVIDIATAFKFDIFPLSRDPFQQTQFSRRRYANVTHLGGPIEFAVASPEDVILSKLRWYAEGGRFSQQQWNDVLGVIAVQGERLDSEYLRHWARRLNIEDLLNAVLAEGHEPR